MSVVAAAQRFSAWNDATPMLTQPFAAEAAPARTDRLSPRELGDLAWSAELDVDDRAEAVADTLPGPYCGRRTPYSARRTPVSEMER